MARASVEELTDERASLIAATEQEMAESDAWAARIPKLEVAAAKCDLELRVVLRAVRSSKGCVAAGEDKVNTTKARAHETLDKMSKLQKVVEGRNGNFNGEHSCVVELVDAELVCVRLVITAALSESESSASEAICHVCGDLYVEASFRLLLASAGGSSEKA